MPKTLMPMKPTPKGKLKIKPMSPKGKGKLRIRKMKDTKEDC